ncbi:hypothetical protein [Anthocerotibacter panamensis]|uniref:hypothetical protein n=1 Tax=Anthocerotibacter panamensis TaxID=2857077 RepID=UPI001C4028A2|nr:hypothetical protein [Anthocerotibacter panamensis]
MTPKVGLLLAASCVAAIAAVGCVFELASGVPKYGSLTTAVILIVSAPATIYLFITAVKEGRKVQ